MAVDATSDEAKLQAARELMSRHNYAAAKAILDTMPDNPQAQYWLETIAQLAPEGEKPKRGNADPYGQDEFFGDEPRKAKRAPEPEYYGSPVYEDYTAKAGIILIVYSACIVLSLSLADCLSTAVVIGLVGLGMNIAYLSQARSAQRRGVEVKGIGWLWFLLVALGLLLCAAVLFFYWLSSLDLD